MAMIDINVGRFNQLKTLNGVGGTYAKRIIEGRPYQRTDELVTKNILPQRNYDRLKEHIMTRPK
ncbi:MAG: helix-hairpin-helix domain-containing protein [Nitrospira sp.]|nr:helix-hairpin-helix domain-containing protein [Nitrospira sp.]